MQGQDYAIEAQNLGPNNDVVIEIYNAADLDNPLADDQVAGSPHSNESLDFHCSQSGIYYVKFFTVAGIYGPGTEYKVKIGRKYASALDTVKGTVLNSVTSSITCGRRPGDQHGRATDITNVSGGTRSVARRAAKDKNYREKSNAVPSNRTGERDESIQNNRQTPALVVPDPTVANTGPRRGADCKKHTGHRCHHKIIHRDLDRE